MNDLLIDELKQSTYEHCFWRRYLGPLSSAGSSAFSIHLAILVEPYLEYILNGSKTIESRFSKNRIAPFGAVESGDVVLLRGSNDNSLSGLCLVRKVWSYYLDSMSLGLIRSDFEIELRVESSSFWEERKEARFATLMRISDVCRLPPIAVPKRDRRGWVVLQSRQQSFSFD